MIWKLGRTGKVDRELEQFRNLMQPPSTFEEGFTWPAFFGALFVALVMVPGAIYMALIAGTQIGPAAQWVTVILFIEVARRAHKSLKKAEIFTLFYLTGAIMAPAAVATGLFHGGLRLLWNQFYIQSSAAQASGIAEHIPSWVAPGEPGVLDQRSVFMWEWLPAVGLIVVTTILSRIDNMVLGYGLFRVASDVEKLPFPMAPLGAQGILALSEEQAEESAVRDIGSDTPQAKSWRWRVFSVGSFMGLIFGAVYLGVPIVSGALLDRPIVIFPIPFYDMTQITADIFPAVAVAISWNLGMLVVGMMLPFFAMLGSFLGLVIVFIANPILHRVGILHSWNPTDKYIRTLFKNNIDFYFSFSIGVSLSIATVGIASLVKGLRKVGRIRRRRAELGEGSPGENPYATPPGRGDIKAKAVVVTYIATTSLYITVSCLLLYAVHGEVHRGVLAVMLFYGFLYTPLISYATARLEGIAGQVVTIPFVREASFILSGYRGVAVWFLPIPLHNYGARTVFYRQAELTGTKFGSIWKAEILLTPLVIVCGLIFAHVIWHLGSIPGPQYLFAQEMWELYAENQSIVYSSTLGGFSEFEQAFNWRYLASGFGAGTALFGIMAWLGAPTFLIYGLVRGLGQVQPHAILLQFAGALIGRYYFQKRMGLKWRQYIPVVAAGFSCGVGLVGTLGVGITFLVKSVFQLPF